MLHKAVQIVGHLGFGHSGVGSGLNADHAALGSNGLNHLIAGHPLGVPHAFCTHMAHNDRLLGIGDRIISSLRAAVGYVNEHTHLVHSLYALFAEHGQAAVMDLLAAVAQRIAFGIGHTQLADAQAVENIDAVYLVSIGAAPSTTNTMAIFPAFLAAKMSSTVLQWIIKS